jgi:type II secretory pathway component GspD/PulD (secretin)/tetratricopeptide (TPR) repeat protein
VFFNRFGQQAPVSSSSPANLKKAALIKTEQENLFRRRAVAVAMAVQLALPFGMLNRASKARAGAVPTDGDGAGNSGTPAKPVTGSFEQLFGTTRDAMPKLSAAAGPVGDAFQGGIDQILSGDYDKAVLTIQNVPVDGLSLPDGKIVDETLARTREAAREQRTAKADLMAGQEAVNKKQFTEAATSLRRSMSNGFADSGTREAAARQLAVVRLELAKANTAVQPIHADVTDAPKTDGTQLAQATPQQGEIPSNHSPVTTVPVVPDQTPAPVQGTGSGDDSSAGKALAAAVKFKAIQKQKNMYDAQKLVDKARAEQSSNQHHEALADFAQAKKLDPENVQANEGYQQEADLLGLGTSVPRASAQQNDIAVRRQAIIYHFEDAITRADTDITAKKFADAQKDIEQAEVYSRQDPTLFLQPEINDFNTRIQQSRVKLDTAKIAAADADSQQALKDTLENQQKKEERYRKEQEKTITGLIQDARQFTDEGKYIEALAVVDHIQKLDPNNTYAGGVRQFLEDKAANQRQRKYIEDFNVNFTAQLNDAKERIVPYDDIIRYSPDWPKISEMRDEEVAAERGEDEENAALHAQLERHLPDLRFNANSLSDVIDFLRDATGTNIYVDWPALERASIARDAPVTAKLHDIKFSKALELIFKSVEGEDEDKKLGYTLDEGVITISTKKELSKNTITRRYDINDLLFVAPDYNNAPDLSLQNASQGQSGGGGGGGGNTGGGQSLFNNTTTSNNNPQQASTDRANRVDEIKKFITDNVDTTTWKDNGGDVGSISSSPLRAVLLITQTPEAHQKVQSVLDSLRASQALQVSIETRFLIVQRNYLEDIGVNANFEFNPLQNPANSRSGVNSSRFTPVSITQTAVTNNTTFVDANGNTVANSAQGSRTLDWISNVGNAAVPGSIAANPADYPNPLVVSGSYVDNLTVTFLIRAVQANVNTTSLTAPRLTLFSGQTAVLIVQTQQAYVSNLTPVVAPGAALFDPTVSTTTATGVVLKVQATVSPDRKYVYLNLQPQLARLRALVPFSISAVVQPANGVINPGNPQIVSGTLQLPTIDLTIVQTSCSVPDGATLLLGGQTLAAETTREQGVPVLSKIPFLKRLFTNRATSQDEQILLILVKPTILIQHEQEIKQFPQLSSKVS